MYIPEEMDGTPTLATIRLKNKHSTTWRNRSDWYWLYRLWLEMFELTGALLGLHKDPPKWEMMQISAICLNWMEKRSG